MVSVQYEHKFTHTPSPVLPAALSLCSPVALVFPLDLVGQKKTHSHSPAVTTDGCKKEPSCLLNTPLVL